MKMGWTLSLVGAAVLLTAAVASAQPRGGPGGPGHRPPQEAIDACKSLKAGEACTFSIDGRTVQGTCRGPADKPAACAPNDLPPPDDGHRGPPQQALDACKNLRDGDTCSFDHDGREVKGSCRTGPDGGAMGCAPADLPRHGGHRGAMQPPLEALAACASLKVGDSCSFAFDGRTMNGTCRGPADKPAACAPNDLPPHGGHHGPPAAALDACKSLRDGDSCSFSLDGRSVTGSCRTGPEGQSAACLPSDMPPRRR
ncbi:MAG: hypothetical protein QM765_44095 [Myxococcales bacterium]